MKAWIFALALGLSATLPAVAADDQKFPTDDQQNNPIDIWYDDAMGKTNGSTYAMINVEGKAYEKWDAELNVVYLRLLHKLNTQDQARLKDAERHWIAWRDSEYAFSDGFWSTASGNQMGTLDRFAAIHEKVETIRARALQLMEYEEDLAHPP
jgi:uncharacterized protein YecT (DUF1311 family)